MQCLVEGSHLALSSVLDVGRLCRSRCGFILGAKKMPVFEVIDLPDENRWAMTCTCEDFSRHAEGHLTEEDLEKRKVGAKNVTIVRRWQQYGAMFFRTETADKRPRFHDVTLVKGGDAPWLCKHMIAVVLTGILNVHVRHPEIVLESEEGDAVNGVRVVEKKTHQDELFKKDVL